jgi:hypothetical protein
MLIVQTTFAQVEGFERTYLFGDTSLAISNIQQLNNHYYLHGEIGNISWVDRKGLFAELDENGNPLDSVITDSEMLWDGASFGTASDKNINFRGNFVYSYNTVFNPGFNLIEIEPNGHIVFDTLYASQWTNDTLEYKYFSLECLKDSTYLISYQSVEYSIDTLGNYNPDKIGVVLMKISVDGDILWRKYFYPNILTNEAFQPLKLFVNAQNQVLLVYRFRHTGQFQNQAWDKIRILTLDQAGNIEETYDYQETTSTFGTDAFAQLEDGTILLSYYKDSITATTPYLERSYQPVIACLNPDKSVRWKFSGCDFYNDPDDYFSSLDFAVKDSVVYFTTFHCGGEFVFKYMFTGLKISDGSLVLRTAVSSVINSNPHVTVIKDIDTTSDGGFVLAGYKWKVQSNDMRGYVVKLNCLGFTFAPQASLELIKQNELQTTWKNNSIGAGSYLWDFGDGTTYTTAVNEDTVSHTFPSSGNYWVQLIAVGCNDHNDTLRFLYSVQDSTTLFGANNALTVFPNPSSAQESIGVFIGKISENNALQILDTQGKLVKEYKNLSPETTFYLNDLFLSSGLYVFRLQAEGKVLDEEKVVRVE